MVIAESKLEETKVKAPKQLILNAFVMTTPTHLSPGLWRHPRNRTDEYNKLSYWTDLAQLVDKAGFHCMFVADTLRPYDIYKGPENVDPVLGRAISCQRSSLDGTSDGSCDQESCFWSDFHYDL
jgi:hypothetical protein